MYIKKAIFRKSHTTNVKQFANVNVKQFANVNEERNLLIIMKEVIYQC